jgi:hypothetical protein
MLTPKKDGAANLIPFPIPVELCTPVLNPNPFTGVVPIND